MDSVRDLATYEAANQSPPYVDVDLFGSDQPLQDAIAASAGGADTADLSAFGRRWGTAAMFDLGRQANENTPKLNTFDSKGFRLDAVEFHPAYHRFLAESMAAGLHASTWGEDLRPGPRPGPGPRHPRRALLYGRADRDRPSLSHHDAPRRRRRARGRARARGHARAEDCRARIRPALAALEREDGHHARHGNDGKAGR